MQMRHGEVQHHGRWKLSVTVPAAQANKERNKTAATLAIWARATYQVMHPVRTLGENVRTRVDLGRAVESTRPWLAAA
jgi:hypothetical protein